MKGRNPSHALATVLVDELVRCGLRHASLAPGSRSAPLAMALHDHPDVHLHVGIDERSAAFLALGIARASGRPAVVVSTSGTAAVNFHPAVVEADLGHVPLLVLTADRPPELRHTGANQTIDQLKLYGSAVRWSVEVGAAEDRPESVPYWRSLADRAWSAALGTGAPAGPVHLNCAFRDPLVPVTEGEGFTQPLDGRADGQPWTSVARAVRLPGEGQVRALADEIAATDRGLVVVGDTPVPTDPVVELAAAAGWPLLAEAHSGARRGPNAIGSYHALLASDRFAERHRPDLVIRVGRVVLSKPLLRALRPDVAQVLIDGDGDWADPARAVGRVVVADPATLCAQVAAALDVRRSSGWLDGWREADRAASEAVDRVLDASDEPSEPRTARDLVGGLPDGSTLVVASSMPVRDLDRYVRPREGLRVVANRGASGIDGFVSTALGVALATDGPVTALAGDLSLLHDQNGFLLTGRPRLDLVVVVVNNDGGGIFSFLPQHEFADSFETVFGTPHGVDPADLARTYDLGHRHVERAGDLVAAVDAARAAGGIHLVEVRTDREANLALHRRLDEAVADVV